ncbi:MAG: hypothetical protein NUV98_02640 [Candidatus Roizmanbacteria bacterium]|nr:hypothetical protein [Candidatus Roizmanbacteria bacterium]
MIRDTTEIVPHENGKGLFNEAYKRFNTVWEGMEEILEREQLSDAYSHFDEEIDAAFFDGLSDPVVRIGMPDVVQFGPRAKPGTTYFGEGVNSYFFIPRNETIVVCQSYRGITPSEFDMGELRDENVAYRTGTLPLDTTKKIFRPVHKGEVLREIHHSIEEESGFTPEGQGALSHLSGPITRLETALERRRALKDRYREDYGGAIRDSVRELTRALIAQGKKLPRGLGQIKAADYRPSCCLNSVGDVRTDIDDAGFGENPEDYKRYYLWYDYEKADLWIGPHANGSEKGPDRFRTERASDRLWCLVRAGQHLQSFNLSSSSDFR